MIKIKTFQTIQTKRGPATKVTYRDGITPMSAVFPCGLADSQSCKDEIKAYRLAARKAK